MWARAGGAAERDGLADGLVITVRGVGVGAPTVALVVAVSPLLMMTAVAMAPGRHHGAGERRDRAPASVGRPAQIAVAVLVGEVVGSVCVVNLVVGVVRVVVDHPLVEIVECVSDGADVTDVKTEDRPACGTLAELGANRYLPDLAFRLPRTVAIVASASATGTARPLACC